RRLLQASLARLRAEHDLLQARIHALGQQYAKRASEVGHAEPKEWADIRRPALSARQLLEVHDAPMLNAIASGGHSANALPTGPRHQKNANRRAKHRRFGP